MVEKDMWNTSMVVRKHKNLTADRFLYELNRLLAEAGIGRINRSGYVWCGVEDAAGETDEPVTHLRFGRILEFIDRHTGDTLDLQRLASEANLSPYHFSRVFRDETGKPPLTYVREARVEKARKLLDEGSPLSEVAYAAGFSDQSHLTREFKKKTGKTPGQYRRDRKAINSKDIQDRDA